MFYCSMEMGDKAVLYSGEQLLKLAISFSEICKTF